MGVIKQSFGFTKEKREASRFTITNTLGMKAVVSDFGAVLVELHVPDKNGAAADVVLGGETVSDYEGNGCYLGATVGRNANRIAGAAFELNGVKYQIPVNENSNNLHSGPQVYNERLWESEYGDDEMGSYVTFSLHSPDGDQGYPGTLDISVTYIVSAEENSLMIHYHGICDKDTIVNLTNHSYFNLGGHDSGTILGHKVWIDADYITEATAEAIPTGKLLAVSGTPMDFTTEKLVGQEIGADYEPIINGGGYDHNYCLNAYDKTAAEHEIALVARLSEETSGRSMEVYTDLPGLQLYSGNFLKGTFVGKGGYRYENRTGICFETQYYPNAVNEPSFPSPVLKAGEEYDTTTIYVFKA